MQFLRPCLVCRLLRYSVPEIPETRARISLAAWPVGVASRYARDPGPPKSADVGGGRERRRLCRRSLREGGNPPGLAFTIYSFTPKISCTTSTSQSSFYCPLHLHCPHSCNTIARLMSNIQPPPDLPCVCHTPYNIGDGNIV